MRNLCIVGAVLAALAAVSPAGAAPSTPAAPGQQTDTETKREALLKGVAAWKVMIPEGENDAIRKSFLPDLERIEREAGKPEADLKDLEKQFTLWKNLFLSEMQAAGKYKDPKAFLELQQERMKALVTVSQFETKAGAAGAAKVEDWKTRINGVRDAVSLRMLFDNMRASVGSAAAAPWGASARYASDDSIYTGRTKNVSPEQSKEPPDPANPGFSPGAFTAVKNYLLARGARQGVIGQTIQLVWDEVKRYSMNPALVLAVIFRESGYNPNAVSSVGAKGLMQIMPGTGQGLGLREWELYDPVKNVKAGIKYLSMMLAKFNGDVKKAIAAYNAGPGAVEKYNGVPPYKETKGYVRKVYETFLDLWNLIQ